MNIRRLFLPFFCLICVIFLAIAARTPVGAQSAGAEVHHGASISVAVEHDGPLLGQNSVMLTALPAAELPELAFGWEAVSAENTPPSFLSTDRGPSDFMLYRNADVQATANISSYVGPAQPSMDVRQDTMLLAGSGYAALSSDAGQSWVSVDTGAIFGSADGGTAGVNHVLFSAETDTMIWLTQTAPDSLNNRLRLGYTAGSNLTAQMQPSDWCYVDIFSYSLGQPLAAWFDSPQVAIGDQFAYFSANVYTTQAPIQFLSSVIWRVPLTDLAAPCGSAVTWDYFAQTTAAPLPVAGITDTAYFGSHDTQSELHVVAWPAAATGFTTMTVPISAWTQGTDYSCVVDADGSDPCAAADGRMQAGWVANGALGFMWNAKQDTTHPYPHVRIATVNQSDFSLLDEPHMWNTQHALLYPSVAVNGRGHIAGSVMVAGGAYAPVSSVYLNDDLNGPPPSWELYGIASSSHGPDLGAWGHYVSARAHHAFPNTWVATGYALQGGSSAAETHPYVTWFGRERDLPALPPSNDSFDSPVVFTETVTAYLQMTDRATTSHDDPIPSCGLAQHPQSNSVWFELDVAQGGVYQIDTIGSGYDTVIALWQGERGDLVELACDDDGGTNDAAVVSAEIASNAPIYIEVMDQGQPGGGVLSLSVQLVTPTAVQLQNVDTQKSAVTTVLAAILLISLSGGCLLYRRASSNH